MRKKEARSERREARKTAPRDKKVKNALEIYNHVLREWAGATSPDMVDEVPRERLLDAMLRLFESLDDAGLRSPLAAQDINWQSAKPYLVALHDAIRWQLLVLELSVPKLAAPVAPTVLTLAALRWMKIWLADDTSGQSKLMAAIDRDLGRLDVAVQQFMRF